MESIHQSRIPFRSNPAFREGIDEKCETNPMEFWVKYIDYTEGGGHRVTVRAPLRNEPNVKMDGMRRLYWGDVAAYLIGDK